MGQKWLPNRRNLTLRSRLFQPPASSLRLPLAVPQAGRRLPTTLELMKLRSLLLRHATQWLISSAILGLCFALYMQSGSNVIATWKQSPSIHYKSFDPYILSVIAHGKSFGFLSIKDEYIISITRSGDGPPGYGHRFNVSFFPDGNEEKHIQSSSVEWSQDGVTFIEPTGHKVFFPANSFIGGR